MPETLCFTRLLQDFELKKRPLLEHVLAPSWTLPSPEPCILQCVLTILQVSFLGSKKGKKSLGAGQMGQVGARVTSHGPDSTDHNTPSRTDDRKTFALVKPPT